MIQPGCLDDASVLEANPSTELNISHRVAWANPLPDAQQKLGY